MLVHINTIKLLDYKIQSSLGLLCVLQMVYKFSLYSHKALMELSISLKEKYKIFLILLEFLHL